MTGSNYCNYDEMPRRPHGTPRIHAEAASDADGEGMLGSGYVKQDGSGESPWASLS